MMVRTWMVILGVFFNHSMSLAQDYTIGFEMLENGSFDEAETFFNNQIELGNDDFTAKLCYARAVGLSGEPKKAKDLFTALLAEEKDNFELRLNYAESLMWCEDYQRAKVSYRRLLEIQPESFPANLGLANALSNLQEFDSSLVVIKKALELQPNNVNALISYKYIRLGHANKLHFNGKLKEAIRSLESLLQDYENDIDLTLALVNFYQEDRKFRHAKQLLQEISFINTDDYRIDAAMARLMLGQLKFRAAQTFLEEAKDKFVVDSNVIPLELVALDFNINLAREDYGQAKVILAEVRNRDQVLHQKLNTNLLLSNKQHSELAEVIDTIDEDFKNVALAQIKLQNGDFWSAEESLVQIENKQSTEAMKYYLGKEIQRNFYQQFNTGLQIMQDNGGNQAQEFSAIYTSSTRRMWGMVLGAEKRWTQNQLGESANRQSALLSATYRYHQVLQTSFGAKITQLGGRNSGMNSHNFVLYNGEVKVNFSSTHFAKLSMSKSIYDYNADLIKSAVSEHRSTLTYYNQFYKKMGIYFEGSNLNLSDDNRGQFVYFSLFNNFRTLPILQAGFNVTYLNFDQNSSSYFSPSHYLLREVFMKFDNRYHPTAKYFVSLLASMGQQQSTELDPQFTQRFEFEAGYKHTSGSTVSAYYRYNNASSAVLSGYQVRIVGIQGQIRF